MRRVILAGLLCLAGPAAADTRVELTPLPDLDLLATVFHLDRYQGDRDGWAGSAAAQVGVEPAGLAASVSAAAGDRTDRATLAATSELAALGDGAIRGRHRALFELRTDDRSDDFGGSLALDGALDHGRAAALAPVARGPGRSLDARAGAEAMLRLGTDHDDTTWALSVRGDGGVVHWLDAPVLASATHGALELGIGRAFTDGELPRGTLDLVRARIEHTTIDRPLAAAGSALRPTEIRSVALTLGAHDFTLHIDRELLAVLRLELGWTWLETDAHADNLFALRLASTMRWRLARDRVHELGAAIVREPSHTPDGQRLVADWRLELAGALDERVAVLSARGGISWLQPLGPGMPRTLLRYATQLEAFWKLGHGLEAGGYAMLAFEPTVAGDPWAAARTWSSKAGLAARWRATVPRAAPPADPACGGVY